MEDREVCEDTAETQLQLMWEEERFELGCGEHIRSEKRRQFSELGTLGEDGAFESFQPTEGSEYLYISQCAMIPDSAHPNQR